MLILRRQKYTPKYAYSVTYVTLKAALLIFIQNLVYDQFRQPPGCI